MRIDRKRRWLPAVALAAVLTGSGSLAGPVSAAEFKFNPGAWLDLYSKLKDYVPAVGDIAQSVAGPSQLSYSGKFTVLLVGSDWRPNSGERLDTILIMSVNPQTNPNTITAASIPRDMARIPIPSEYGGGTYKGKINGMFKFFKKQSGGNRNIALNKFKHTIEHLLDIKIDGVAYLRFSGFDALVDEVGYVPVNNANELRDPSYIDKPGYPTGARFVVENPSLLRGANTQRCYGGYPKPVTNWSPVMHCHRALVYVRSRHGKIVGQGGNNDYVRAARQQRFVFAAIKRVTAFTLQKSKDLRGVANSMPSAIYTSLPTDDGSLMAIYNLLDGATFKEGVVFKPKVYATHIAGTSSNQLKLNVVRAKCNSLFDGTPH